MHCKLFLCIFCANHSTCPADTAVLSTSHMLCCAHTHTQHAPGSMLVGPPILPDTQKREQELHSSSFCFVTNFATTFATASPSTTMALLRLSPADIEALAGDAQPLLSSLPHRPRDCLGPRPPRPSRRTPAHRAQDRPLPVSRRMRRYHNDTLLAITAAESGHLPTTAAEYRRLFEPSSTSTWSTLHQDDDARRAWHHFVEMTDDEQIHLLQHKTPTVQKRVDKTLKLLIKQRGPFVRNVVRHVEDKVVRLPRGGVVHLKLPHAHERMVAHRVAQFHCMKHQSVDIGSERVTVIHATNPVGPGPRLLDVLAS